MGESRQELLLWLNELLQLNLTKIEQVGTGAALCQVIDSIFGDVPMSKVKFNVNSEYQYVQNFKILQNSFTKHRIEKPIPVERLVKCKMQDNLEFTQWIKKFWDQYFPGGEYDAVARRKGQPAPAASAIAHSVAPVSHSPRPSTGGGAKRYTPVSSSATSAAAAPRARTPQTSALQQQNAQLRETIDGLEKERDFYFNKLRDIEILVQQAVEADPEIVADDDGLIRQVQAILYSTEEGFEVPETVTGDMLEDDEEETF